MTATEPSCPAWCVDHQAWSDIEWHQSAERVVHGHTLFVASPNWDPETGRRLPEEIFSGGIYFLRPGEALGDPSTLKELRAEIADVEVEAKGLRALANALRQAIAEYRGVAS